MNWKSTGQVAVEVALRENGPFPTWPYHAQLVQAERTGAAAGVVVLKWF